MKNSWFHFWKARNWKGQLVGIVYIIQWPVLKNAEVTLTQHYDSFEWK